MEHQMFIVKYGDEHFGPFTPRELGTFLESRKSEPMRPYPLLVPSAPGESKGPLRLCLISDEEAAHRRDAVRIDSVMTLKAIMWELQAVRQQRRVLTVAEILALWDRLFQLCRAMESLIFHTEAAVADPRVEHLVALRRALWRNRDADDVDEHYYDRFW